ncbi:MAG TPA: hypothetical protein VE978_05830 [Chitinophagales bacterium]|nr:hypothetical protein [Chitinophagales bacterium]
MTREALILISIVMRIAATIYCVDKAGKLNRSKNEWGFLAFFFPVIACIWIQFIKPKEESDSYEDVDRAEPDSSPHDMEN